MKEISVEEFKQVINQAHERANEDYINVCEPGEYKEQCIEGVRNVPLSRLESHLHELADKDRVYIHCRSGKRGAQAIDRLKQAGISSELINVSGGLMAWSEAGYPTKTSTTRLPIMRQVLIAAGSLVMLGYLGGMFVHPYLLYIVPFVALGLLVAGITGWCGMALLLGNMPWNK